MKNLKKPSGVVRLNDTVGVTKKCSEDWKVCDEFITLQGSVPNHPFLVFVKTSALDSFLVAHSVTVNWLTYTPHVLAKPL